MLTITRRQMQAMEARANEAFAARALETLRGTWRARLALLDGVRLRSWAVEGVARARALGCETEVEICHYLNLCLVVTEFGLTFTWPDWAKALLASRDMPSVERLDAVLAEWRRRAELS